MKCDEFEAHLNEILDERRRPEWDEQLRSHGEQCRGCRDLAAAYGVLFEGFFALPAVETSADFAARVLECLHARPRRMQRRLAILGAVFSTAAAVLVAVMLNRADEPAGQQVAAATTQQVPATQQAPAGLPAEWDEVEDIPVLGPLLVAMDESDKHNEEQYAALAKNTGQGLAAIILRMPGVAGPQGVRPPSPAANLNGVWPTEVSDELRPVTQSVTETFNLLLKALPVSFAPSGRPRAS